MFGHRIKELRKTLHLTQTSFAEALGMTTNAVYEWEHNKVKIKETSLRLIETTFNVSPEWLRHGIGSIFQKPENELAPHAEDIVIWLKSMSYDEQIWLKVEMMKRFPEYKQWCEKYKISE